MTVVGAAGLRSRGPQALPLDRKTADEARRLQGGVALASPTNEGLLDFRAQPVGGVIFRRRLHHSSDSDDDCAHES